MAVDPTNQLPYKILNMTITTNDVLTARVLHSARSVKRLNAIVGMMLEAYLATPEGQVMAAQQLRIPVSELGASVQPAGAFAAQASVTRSETAANHEAVSASSAGKSGINFDKLCV